MRALLFANTESTAPPIRAPYSVLSRAIGTFVASMIVAVLIYALLAFLLGILTRDDVTSIPLLNRLVRQK